MVYSIQTGSRKGSRTLSNNRAIVFVPGCRVGNAGGRGGGERTIDSYANDLKYKRISCQDQMCVGGRRHIISSSMNEYEY